tara:strand:+ start:21412 stop:22059 length:648 start_codon:yes stop_codon:yes gene_type:complete
MLSPFSFKIIDSFLEEKDFNFIINSLDKKILEKIGNNEIKIFPHKFTEREIQTSSLSKERLRKFHEKYHPKCMEILKDLCPERLDLYDYSEFDIVITGKNYKFPIHSDTPNKILSCVVYLDPLKNNGTFLYEDKQGNGKQEVEWKQNRALFFSRKENGTWHSYEGNNRTTRIVLVYNLMTKQIKKVYKLEGKSFYIGTLKSKINPFLYKYFGITI